MIFPYSIYFLQFYYHITDTFLRKTKNYTIICYSSWSEKSNFLQNPEEVFSVTLLFLECGGLVGDMSGRLLKQFRFNFLCVDSFNGVELTMGSSGETRRENCVLLFVVGVTLLSSSSPKLLLLLTLLVFLEFGKDISSSLSSKCLLTLILGGILKLELKLSLQEFSAKKFLTEQKVVMKNRTIV